MVLSVNDAAPGFSLPCETGNNISLESLKGKNVVLYFYPKDDTPGCTQEAKDFSEKYAEFEKLDTVVVGISKDSVKKHIKFKDKYQLPFSLIADEEVKTISDYGVWVEKSMYGKKYMGIERATFLIDKNGIISKIWPKVKVTGHIDEVLEAVKNIAKK